MASTIITALVGVLLCFFGYRNIKGDISSLHSYHRNRVKEEDVKPFGRLVGIGNIISGVAVIVFSIFMFITLETNVQIFTVIGTALLIAGLVGGMGFAFYAMKKYNGGIF